MIRIGCNALVLSIAILTGSTLAAAQSAASTPTQAKASADAAQESSIPPDQQPTQAQIAKLFETLRLRQQMDNMMQAMAGSITQQVQQQTKEMIANLPNSNKISPEEMKAIEDFQKKWMDRAMHIVPYDDFIADLTEVYQKHVSKTDVDAVIAFYASPAGQHLLDEQPVIMKEYMPKVMARVSVRSKEMNDEMMKDIAAMVKQYEPAKTPVKEKPASAPPK
jgi:hypothetical protein